MLFAFCVVLSPSLVYLRVRAGSVMAVALFWSMLITLTRTALDLAGGAPSLYRPFFGLGGILAVLLLLAALSAHDRYVAPQGLMTERARPARRPQSGSRTGPSSQSTGALHRSLMQ